MRRFLLMSVMLALGASTVAEAAPSANKNQFWYRNSVFGRVNPLGLINFLRIGYKRRLEISDTAFGRDTYAFIGASAVASPAFGRVGVHAEIEPVALLRFSGTYEFVGYFGTFDQIASFPTSDVNYSDTALGVLGDAGETRGRIGQVATLSGIFKFKYGPVAVRNTMMASYFDLQLPTGDIAFYDQIFDRLAPDRGWMILNDAEVFGVLEHARFGVRYTYSASFHADPVGDGALPHHRLGPLFAWQFHDHKERSRFDKPTLFVLAQWWLQHPYRTGQDVSQAFPVISLGLSFEGDLLWKGPPAGKKKGGKKK